MNNEIHWFYRRHKSDRVETNDSRGIGEAKLSLPNGCLNVIRPLGRVSLRDLLQRGVYTVLSFWRTKSIKSCRLSSIGHLKVIICNNLLFRSEYFVNAF